MKIALIGGRNKADFLVGLLLRKNNKVVVVNTDEKYCEYLSAKHAVTVYCGDGCKNYVLEDAQIDNFDILIALTDSDADNLWICQTAKKIFNVKRAVCTVSNPKNVEIFKSLGVNTVISATYMLAQFIEQASTVENLVKTLSIADNQVLISEVLVESAYPIVGKKVFEIKFPPNVIISCLIRNVDVIIPNGQTVILTHDKLLIISAPQNQQEAIFAVTGVSADE